LKEWDHEGFTFFTNYQSRKAMELLENPYCAMTFHWNQRQVRVEGKATKISEQESDLYFMSRPKASQIGAWTSHQSTKIQDRSVLEEEEAKLISRYQDL
jgi:pyridoxamine 5'-phosphate oxidase